MKEIWQTTNQQPWVEALASNLISVKTRTSEPHVPIGATVLLHASKSRLWPDWKGLTWISGMNPDSWGRGTIEAIATVESVGWSDKIMTTKEKRFWDVDTEYGRYNSVAPFAVRFSNIKRLEHPVSVRGFQSPYARATKETIAKVLKSNPTLKPYFE